MRKIVFIISVVIILMGTALNVHIVQLDDGFKLLKKTHMSFEDTYVDARGFKKLKILSKPALIEAGIKELME